MFYFKFIKNPLGLVVTDIMEINIIIIKDLGRFIDCLGSEINQIAFLNSITLYSHSNAEFATNQ